jgi:DNA-binding NarL/FixJ family response regulator
MDGPRLKREISEGLPGTEVVRINSLADLDRVVEEGADLLLVNREPVGFEEEGVDLIRRVHRKDSEAKVMLVSDRMDAQAEAVDAGALPGFGKELMGTKELIEAVEEGLEG